MTPNDYQQLAARTECDQRRSLDRLACLAMSPTEHTPHQLKAVRLFHALIGMMGELGELAATVEKWIYYGQELDEPNIKEELGDLLWYVAQAHSTAGLNMEDVMAANIAKLQKRYPDKYTDWHAAEENRDRTAEAEAEAIQLWYSQVVYNTVKDKEPVNPHIVDPGTKDNEHDSSRLIMCSYCGWEGMEKELGHGYYVSRCCQRCGNFRRFVVVGRLRKRSEVIAAQLNAVSGGCCNRFANQHGCDCIEKAIDDLGGVGHEIAVKMVQANLNK